MNVPVHISSLAQTRVLRSNNGQDMDQRRAVGVEFGQHWEAAMRVAGLG